MSLDHPIFMICSHVRFTDILRYKIYCYSKIQDLLIFLITIIDILYYLHYITYYGLLIFLITIIDVLYYLHYIT